MPDVIVAGSLSVDEHARAAYLDSCREVVRAARAAPGCLDFHLSADPLDPARINVFEHWDSLEAVEAFRGDGPPADQTAAIRHAAVVQHRVASSTPL
jgi:quinol monooxygenase YgiN